MRAKALTAPPMAVERAGAIPWYVLAMAVGATSVVLGVIWDISWHRSIGRDTFWTPAHIAIYFGGVVNGCCGGFLALRDTFSKAGRPQEGVRFWGFRAPLGAWVAIWGAIAMLTSAPFDDWWHNAYGLDVEIISPPHMVLVAGIAGIVLGAMLISLAQQNRAPGDRGLAWVFTYAAGVLLALAAVVLTDETWPNEQRTATFYLVGCAIFPAVLAAAGRAGRLRWPATTAAAIYLGLNLFMLWVLPFFPAEPKLAPIYNPIDYMVPLPFPMLLVVPAFGLDLLLRRYGGLGPWRLAALMGVAFFLLFLLTQWFFSGFLLSDGAQNAIFGADRWWGYNDRPGEWQRDFWSTMRDPVASPKAAWALLAAFLACRFGLAWGDWMRRVQR